MRELRLLLLQLVLFDFRKPFGQMPQRMGIPAVIEPSGTNQEQPDKII